jgi:hypothetical protein
MTRSDSPMLDRTDSERLFSLLTDFIHALDMRGEKAPEAALAYAEYFERHFETGRADFDGITHNIHKIF